jgi:hypothetical protein
LLRDSCIKIITIQDNTVPSLSGVPANTTVACAANVPAPANVTASDNCGLVRLNFSQVKQDSTCVNKFIIVRTWTATDSCGNTISASQTITVNDNIKPVITANFEKDISVQCVSQIPTAPTPTANDNCSGDLQPAFSVMGSGNACDSTITRKWIFTDACGNKDSVTQVIHVNDDTKPVITANFEKDIPVQCVSQIPAAPTPTANDNCSGTIQPVFSAIGSGQACDSTITRKWVFTDACGNTDSVSQVIRVKDNTAPVLSGSAPNGSYSCAKDVPAKPTITASDNCDANPVISYSQVTSDSTCVNHFILTRKWYATDNCGNVSPNLTQVIMVNDNQKPLISFTPADATVACTVTPVFGTAAFSDNCGTLTLDSTTWIEGTSCPYKHIRRWTATDACGNAESTSQTITVNCCLVACTYTQGFYGNTGGIGCTMTGTSSTAKEKMTAAVDAQAGDSVYFGLKSTGKFFTLFLSDITSNNIFRMLPGGGTPAALKGYATYSKPGTWSKVPLENKQNQYGKIKNNLLSQTMVLFFNMQGSSGLPGMAIMSDSLFTSKQTSCGSGVAVAKVDTFTLPSNVVQYLKTAGMATVQGLYDLANRYLGGQTVSGITAADVTNAVDAINRGFDECALLAGWGKNPVVTGITGRSATTVAGDNNTTIATDNMQLSVFPNPYKSVVNFRFKTTVSGRVELVIYNIVGARLAVIDKGHIQAGTWQTIQYHVPAGTYSTLVYRLITGSKVMSGKILPMSKE